VFELFSAKVAEYIASRPNYPRALFDELAALGLLNASKRIADLGAGTGIFTRALLDRGCEVIAVEPNAAMRAAADTALQSYPRYRSVTGTAEHTSLAAASIDLITAAQAFHWFDIAAARSECLRILKPEGQVALIWNDRVLTDPLHIALDEIFTKYGGAMRGAVLAHEDRSSVPQFFGSAEVHTLQYPNEQRLNRDGLTSLVLSRSYMPARDTGAGQAAVQDTHRIFDAFSAGDHVTVRYRTIATIGRPALSA
jgi:SAM-dependent methyltransferase